VLISPFYEHRPYRIATAETRVLEDKTLIGAMVEIDANVEAFHVIDELGWDCRAAEVAKVGCDFHWLNALFIFFGSDDIQKEPKPGQRSRHQNIA
jgi:hypothetical protein